MLIKKRIKECDVCHHWYLTHVSKFESNVCSRCHDSLVMSVYLSDTAILNIKSSDYCC